MANIWDRKKTGEAGKALMKAALEAGGNLTYSQGWEKVTGIIGSYATYDKIVNDLVEQGLFGKESDPRDKRVTILRLLNADQATTELQFREALDQIKALAEQPSFPIPREEWDRQRKYIKMDEAYWKHPYIVQHKKIGELVEISHALFVKTLPPAEYDPAHYDSAYISAAHGGGITVLSRSGHDDLIRCDQMLLKILREGKKDPDKEMWLKELGAYQLYLSYRTSEVARAS